MLNTLRTLFVLLILALPAWAQARADWPAHGAAIASAQPLATRAGFEILHRGGNAFDAAVAVAAALAVVEPFGSGLGGGGFWLLHRASDGRDIFVDGRETAPLAATPKMYLDAAGKPIPRASLDGPRAAGIPGTPAALVHLARRYGRLPLAESLAPAIRYAREGFPVGRRYVEAARDNLQTLLKDPRATALYLDHGEPPRPGFRLVQPALARTLEGIARHGDAAFYRGPVAAEMVRAVRAGGGIWRRADLARYRVVERRPIRFHYRGATIVAAPPPSSGGVVLAESLHILEQLPPVPLDGYRHMHDVIEAMRRGYQDRARYLGDPDFVAMPLARLLSRSYAAERARSIRPDAATPSSALGGFATPGPQGRHTTHFSIIDARGNRVAATLTLNTFFGSGFVAGDSGVLLNNEMDDFVMKPGVPNVYGLVGNAENAIQPGKRPLSSMSPTFVENARGVLVLGTPGGSRIISMVLLGILDYVDHPDSTPRGIVSLPRYHHQYLPDVVQIEPYGFSPLLVQELTRNGYHVQRLPQRWGNMQAVFLDARSGRVSAASDPRGEGMAMSENTVPQRPPLPAALSLPPGP